MFTNTQDYYWVFNNALSSDTCDKIIELGLQKEKEIEHGLENEQDLAKKLEELTKRMDIIEKVK